VPLAHKTLPALQEASSFEGLLKLVEAKIQPIDGIGALAVGFESLAARNSTEWSVGAGAQ
jgi:hypothetical protein